jgi:phosphatidylserine/phosphatidylglycerophosphate/cardiolipin synthase-like enzyme
MANVTIIGEVLNSGTQSGVPGLVVGAFDRGVFGEVLTPNTSNTGDALFGQYARTGADGKFSLSLAPGNYDLHVRVLDTVKRELARVQVVNDGQQPIDVGTINLTADEIDGWLATGGGFPARIDGTDVQLWIDNHDAWSQILQAVTAAQTSIEWMLFYLDTERELMSFSPDAADPGGVVTGQALEAALKDAAGRGVKVRLACNQLTAAIEGLTFDIGYPFTTAGHVTSYFENVTNVEIRPMRTPAYDPIHTKFVVIDNSIAFVIGSPFVQDYYDADTHLIDDARHGTFRSWLPDSHSIKVPTHDVSIQLKGSALAALNETFRLHWNTGLVSGAGGILGPAPTPAPQTQSTANVGVQVVRTLAGNERYDDFPHGETSVLESYLRAIAKAQNYIYLENQYFTSHEIADALVLAIKQSPSLQVIFLTNNAVDLPGYSKWHPATIQRVLVGLDATERQRVGFFTVWSHQVISSLTDVTHICRSYIHSKVAIIDDCWATVGSANLDGDSLLTGDNAARGGWWAVGGAFGLRSDGILEENRESETNVVILDGIAGGRACGLAKTLRQRLWAEHLYSSAPDVTPASGNLDSPPAGGWLGLWTTAAQQKLDDLKQSPDTLTAPCRALAIPYDVTNPDIPKTISDPKTYLKLAGVDPDTIVVRDAFRRFDWAKGDWVDAWTEPDG